MIISDQLGITVREWTDIPAIRRNEMKMHYQDGVSIRTLAVRFDLPFDWLQDQLSYLNYARRRRRGPDVDNLRPHGDRVLVRADLPVGVAETTRGGLLVPQQHSRPEPQQGTVVAVGQGILLGDGARLAPAAGAGDRVLFRYSVAGRDLRIAGQDHVLMPEEDILCVLGTA